MTRGCDRAASWWYEKLTHRALSCHGWYCMSSIRAMSARRGRVRRVEIENAAATAINKVSHQLPPTHL